VGEEWKGGGKRDNSTSQIKRKVRRRSSNEESAWWLSGDRRPAMLSKSPAATVSFFARLLFLRLFPGGIGCGL